MTQPAKRRMGMEPFSPATTREAYIATAILVVLTVVMAIVGVAVAPIVGIDLLFMFIAVVLVGSRDSWRTRLAQTPLETPAP